MGNPYTSVSASGYNANPPPDDGSQTEANRVKWATVKSKLADILKTFAEAINTNVAAAFTKVIGGGGITTTAISYTVLAADQGKLVVGTAAGITITTPDAVTVASPFVFEVLNRSAGDITLDGSGSQTINGSGTLTMGPGDGWAVWTDGSNWLVTGRKTGVLPRGYIDGCVLSNGTDTTNDINISAGVCRDSTNAVDIAVTAMAGKQLDANWAPGAAAGMRNSAAGIANGTYHIYAVATAAGVQDTYAFAGVAGTNPDSSVSIAAVIAALQLEVGGSSYIHARRIGSILRVSAAIVLFTQSGDCFRLKTPTVDIATSTLSTTSTNFTLTSVPTGLGLLVKLNLVADHASVNAKIYLRNPDDTDTASSEVSAPLATVNAMSAPNETTVQADVWTNTSAQVAAVSSISSTIFRAAPIGYWDTRGKDG